MKNAQIGIIKVDFGNGNIFDASEIVDKTLIANSDVPIKRGVQESFPVVYVAKRGASIGVVYSWVLHGGDLFWMFYDTYNKPYYAKHKAGLFSINALQQQGSQTEQEKKEEQEAAENPIFSAITKMFKPVILAAAAFFIIKAFQSQENKS